MSSAEEATFSCQAAGWRLPAGAEAVTRARELARATLARWGLEPATPEAVLLISELVTNALVHGRAPIHLHLSCDGNPRMLQCQVSDASPEEPRQHPADSGEPHGRGLMILAAIASSHGWHVVPGGKAVWFTYRIPDRS
nr:ATP-binding protein [Bailinhaonella thermotolerans]